MKAQRTPVLTISSLIESNLAEHGAHVAIEAPDRVGLTYSGLFSQFEATLRELRQLGIDRTDKVAVVLPNGPEMATSFLAVGACCICAPLNPTYKKGEFEFYLEDLSAKAIIIHSEDKDTPAREAARAKGVPVIELVVSPTDPAGAFTLRGSPIAPPVKTGFSSESDVALVLHTSGTTARPKIVPLAHANICHSAQNIKNTIRLTHADRCLNIMPLFHIHGLIGALLSSMSANATVICTPGFVAPNFFAQMALAKPTWYTAVPTMHQAILARAAGQESIIKAHPLRFIRSSSASLPENVKEGLEKAFGTAVIEAYGMTEASHQIASNPLPPQTRKVNSVGLAGGPKVGIMNSDGQLLKPREMGEIVIQGPSITSGYERNPEANTKSFTNGWFRTGDLGYLDEAGYLFIEGRIKEMINRAGEKVSPLEVEAILLKHPSIAQAVSFAVPDEALGEAVGAAVVLKEGCTSDREEILSHVEKFLSDHKVPRHFLILKDIPKGATGKLQRIGLAERLGLPNRESQQGASPSPSGVKATERTTAFVATAWKEILKIEDIKPSDNFFLLGGDSILAVMFISRARTEFGVELTARALYDNPTVDRMASEIETRQARGNVKSLDVKKVAQNAKVPASAHQERWIQIHEMAPLRSNATVSSYRIKGRLDTDSFQKSLKYVVNRHEALRTYFEMTQKETLQHVAGDVKPRFEVLDLRRSAELDKKREIKSAVDKELNTSFDLNTAPLWSFRLALLSENESLLIVNFHHSISDYWSKGIVLRELMQAYEAYVAGQKPKLVETSIQYRDYSAWYNSTLNGAEHDKKVAFWKARLDGVTGMSFSEVFSKNKAKIAEGALHFERIPADVIKRLKQKCNAQQVPVTVLIQSVLTAHWLNKSGEGATKAHYGMLIAVDREKPEFMNLVGILQGQVSVAVDLVGVRTLADIIDRTKASTLDSIDHFVPATILGKSQQNPPVPNIVLNFQNSPADSVLKAGGIEMKQEDGRLFESFPTLLGEMLIATRESSEDQSLHFVILYRKDRFPDPAELKATFGALIKSITDIANGSEEWLGRTIKQFAA